MRVGAILTELGFTSSNAEAKRKIAEGAVRLDDAVVADPALLVALPAGSSERLSLGRKKHAVLRGPVA
jgi:tyrosyl-tRNA synthetase